MHALEHGLERAAQLGDVLADKYRLDTVLGKGASGTVFAATHLVTGRAVAIKWLNRGPDDAVSAWHRAVREAHAAGRIRHDHIVDVYDVCEHEGSLFLVMERLDGQSLDRFLAGTRVTASALIELLLPAVRAVAAAHRQGVIHRDIKPANIFICTTPEGTLRAKILDFGISKLKSRGEGDVTLTQTGATLGTPAYMAPEQLEDGKHVDERADVYAFGVVLYEALAGQRPFQAEGYPSLVLKIMQDEPAPLGPLPLALPAGLEAVVMRALQKRPEARYASMDALAEALAPFAKPALQAVASAGEATPSEPSATQPDRGARSRPGRWIVAFSVVALLAWLAISLTGNLDQRPQAAAVDERQPIPVIPASDRRSPPAMVPLHPDEAVAAETEAPAPPQPLGHLLRVQSEPAGAMVWVADQFVCNAPCDVPIPEGGATVRASRAGYEAVTSDVTTDAHGRPLPENLHFRLPKRAPSARKRGASQNRASAQLPPLIEHR